MFKWRFNEALAEAGDSGAAVVDLVPDLLVPLVAVLCPLFTVFNFFKEVVIQVSVLLDADHTLRFQERHHLSSIYLNDITIFMDDVSECYLLLDVF